jgi:hypothetical protein
VERFLEDVEARHLAEATVAKQKILLSRLVAFADEIGVKYISLCTRGRFTLTRRPPSVSFVRVLPQYWCVRSA